MDGPDLRQTILLVEDEAIIALAESQKLKKLGFTVITANSGEKALVLAESDAHIHLILMDINLGSGMDGTEAARRILILREIPIVFLTSHAEREMVDKVKGITRFGYVIKNSGDFVLQSSIEMAFELFETQKKMKENEERFSLINDSSLDFIYSYDRNGRFTSANRALCIALMTTETNIRGKTHAELGFPESQCREWEEFHHTVYETGKTFSAKTSTPMPDGTFRHFEIFLNPLRDKTGTIVGIGGTTRDITERTLAEESLRIKDLVFESSIAASSIADKDGKLRYVNDAFLKAWGYESRSEIVGKTISSFFERPEDSIAVISALKKTERWEGEFRAARKDGTAFTVKAMATTLRGTDGEIVGFQSACIDITESKKTEEALQGTNEIFKAFMDNLPSMAIIKDAALRPVFFNRKFLKAFPGDEQLGKPPEETFPEGLAGSVRESDMKALQEGYNAFEEEWTDSAGRQRMLETQKFIIPRIENEPLLGVIINDITDRRTAEKRLKESEERYRQLFDAESDAVFLIENETGNIIEANNAAAAMYGFPLEELTRMKNSDLSAEPEETQRVTHGTPVIADKVITIPLRMHRKKDGTVMPVEITGRFFVSEGRPVHIAAIRNITERRATEEKIKALLAEKDMLLTEVHHRIKNNMASIMSLLSLQSQSLSNASAIEALQEARNRVQGMAILYEKLYRAGDFREISLKDYLEPLVEEIVDTFPNRDLVKIENSVEDIILDIDRIFPVGIIVNELITNSMKYAFNGKVSPLISISATKSGSTVILSVKDNGNGFPPSFDPSSSLGFGLQLVNMLTLQLRGTVSIEGQNGMKTFLKFPEK